MSRNACTSFQKTATRLWYQLKYRCAHDVPKNIRELIHTCLNTWGSEDYEVHKSWIRELDKNDFPSELSDLMNIIQIQISKTKLFKLVSEALAPNQRLYSYQKLHPTLVTAILLCYPMESLNSLYPDVKIKVKDLWSVDENTFPELCEELKKLRAAMYPGRRCKTVTCKFGNWAEKHVSY
eukprot:TRINITY_DN7859_c0_g1_i2.p1 TRINITY_DN7859_c0_g1~~TRINITY_DN7859_c0_g1_i2.p1  ORF type:complete len:180 (-),score=19.36 TRINITY_DN7859_c0_g1_i2:128-667(-)